MKVTVTFRHMEADSDIKSYAEEKLNRLADKYFQRPKEAQVVLEAEKFRRSAEITLKADNVSLVGKEQKEDIRSSFDLALQKLEAQAKKHREKNKSRNKSSGGQSSFAVYREKDAPGEGFEPEVVKVDRFVPKPYTVEDAVVLLEERSDDFIVFRNADDLQICVLYRMPDGNYGLIETGE